MTESSPFISHELVAPDQPRSGAFFRRRGLPIALPLLVAACQSADYSALSAPRSRVQFKCADGEEVEMRFFPQQGVGVLVRGGETQELQQQPSASGFIYSNGPVTVRGKGGELIIEVGRMAPIRCEAR